MTPKEKAKELVEKMRDEIPCHCDDWEQAKQCALIAVEEIVKSKSLRYLFTEDEISCMEGTSDGRWIYDTFMEYWEEVKQEIEKL